MELYFRFCFIILFVLLSADFNRSSDHLLFDRIPDGLELLYDCFFGVVISFGDHDVDLRRVKYSTSSSIVPQKL